ncbi:alpha/beta fold hydrolase [Hymenobacter cellulosivorans]|uniref:Alpha/beta hydrolase n=1 Tax=Hymenobacter cellulosivorans TaxID=2932249 RepID=A0ABY4FC91_9BACT|nr:alpha/beta hydrolase [Hymenobacter cellulosivorans]UOQ53564.1 alpha/beta hydrolase [Hymenobacter cellulosivorans]
MPTSAPSPTPVQREDFSLPFDGYELQVRRLTPPGAPAQPQLVLLHDSLGCITLWRDFPELLAQATGLTVLAYDRRGYGQSAPFGPEPRTKRYLEEEAANVNRVLAACGIARAVLLGHSDGGTLALLAAALEPARTAAIITIGAHVFVEDVTLAGIRAAQEQYRTTDLPARLARYHGPKTEAVFRAWADTWLQPEFRSWNVESYLPRVTCPVLVLQGTEDEYGTAAQVTAIASGVAGTATAHLLPGLGHSPQRQAPAAVVTLAAEFVAAGLGNSSRLGR